MNYRTKKTNCFLPPWPVDTKTDDGSDNGRDASARRGGFHGRGARNVCRCGACALQSAMHATCVSAPRVVVPCADPAPAAGARPSPACCVEEDQMVQIVPHFTFQDVHFLSGRYGPFQVIGWACVCCVAAASASFPPRARAGCLLSVTVDNTRDAQCTHTHLNTHSRGHGRVRHAPGQAKMPTEVPLWLALQLKQRQLCTIRYGACVHAVD